ncbi:LuxR C-terminal-related transcriptional regulator [Streptomyces sp. NPDC057621]|uniref:Helix-turn-helix transcriptional regulator n=1 Tax=Streptomyces liliiviolaceus TaxID=2823109 RepID=A0A941BDA6_9ACTN|nr:helix-turn-helix transcriptional regulator [Streptomyces liliiviolaceus]MBQ0853918.1 helix-turn-helix transcriptional regulator [Streptomyces liliiviolaceus]
MHLTTVDDPRLLHERFRGASRTTDGPVVVVSGSTLLVNGPAAALTRVADRPLLWEWARHEAVSPIADTAPPRPVPALESGARPRFCEGIWTGRALVGAVVRLTVPAPARPARLAGPDGVRSLRWAELTESQRLVAEYVAGGLTNRQTAALLSVSHHTVDYHLRHVFQKFQIHSRVELARLVAAAFHTPPPLPVTPC